MQFNASLDADFFAESYDNPILNGIMLGIYLMGLLGCAGLYLVSWFEKNGQAGPYRTVVDQLLSCILDHLVFGYIFAMGVDNIRPFIGPLPTSICRMASFCKVLVGCNICVLILAITAVKFYLIKVRKSIPIMDDNLITFVIVTTVSLLNTLATLAKVILDERDSIAASICTGTWGDHYPDARYVPLNAVVGFGSILGQICFSIPVALNKCKYFKKGNGNDLPQNETNLMTLLLTSAYIFGSFLWHTSIILLDEMKTSPGHKMLAFNFFTLFPVFAVTTISVIFFVSHKQLRHLVKRVFGKDDQVYPMFI